MIIYSLAIVSIISFISSFRRDPRKLINAFFLLSALGFSYLSLVQLAYLRTPNIHTLLLGILYVLIPIGILLFAFLMILNGFVVLKREGCSLSNSLSLVMGLLILCYAILVYFHFIEGRHIYTMSGLFPIVVSHFYYIISFLFFVFTFIFISFLIYSIIYLKLPVKKNYDFIIIHGSGLLGGEHVPPLLAARIEKAIRLFELGEKPDKKLIASGGQGSDETISEAEAIARYLIIRGIPKEAIIKEDQSTTTYENLMYSKRLAEKLKKNPSFVFVSNNYHIFRASLYARKLQMDGAGVGAKTAGYYLPSAFIREYIAILMKLRKPLLFVIVIYLVFTALTYLI